MSLVDTHCHIYSDEFDLDRPDMMARAESEGIIKMLMPAIDASTHGPMLALEASFPGRALSMMGLHPCSVKDNYRDELEVAQQWLKKRRFVAVGETGLDFYWDLTYTKQQYEVFQQQIQWALEYEIPVVIHSRNSIDECIGLVAKNQTGKLTGVFHCFSGSLEQAKKIVDLGFYIGIGGVLTFKKAGLDAVLREMGLKNVILETDAPYLAPVPFRGKRNECSYIKYIAEKLAEVKALTVQEIATITTQNAERLFSLANIGRTQ